MKNLTEDRLYELAAGLAEPSSITADERAEFTSLYVKPTTAEVDVLARLHSRLDMDIANLEDEIRTLQDYCKTLKKAQSDAEEGMEHYCSDAINTRVTKGFTFAMKETKAAEIYDEDIIPPEYRREETVVKVDKRLILADLKQDKEIPGAKIKVSRKVTFKENEVY